MMPHESGRYPKGHNFTAEVTAVGDNGSYDYDSMIFTFPKRLIK